MAIITLLPDMRVLTDVEIFEDWLTRNNCRWHWVKTSIDVSSFGSKMPMMLDIITGVYFEDDSDATMFKIKFGL